MDSNPGTQAQPFKTRGKAKAVVAEIIPSMTGDYTITELDSESGEAQVSVRELINGKVVREEKSF
jgi:hypothetical protein